MSIKEDILVKSFETFYKNGFHDSGVSLLAERAGTTKRTLYAHFDNKEGLIEAVLNYRHDMFMTQLIRHFESLIISDSTDVTNAYVVFLKNWITSDNFYGCLFINACAEFSESTSIPHDIARQHKSAVRQFLLEQFLKIKTDNPKRLADTLFVFGEGLIVSAQTGQDDLEWDLGLINGIT
ncbi:TetR/AcrR family transcriptional regulator [Psychrobacter sp. FDAARGOS_221]|uniref:TetR/AcrR family transcriptional regulator n=1 Tax=Psychrobacter sp. FDAARGOS_221 TaxID=1975705 RepID=UPI000BB539D4|nr:TetR/AcrR family transcriptional regulator [Psychrobacter sp. FDAARGOS_221]PNK59849.1 TetR/AcrR family transcriptional regulator [Psychrobacter sp. FDAARGOS_221]